MALILNLIDPVQTANSHEHSWLAPGPGPGGKASSTLKSCAKGSQSYVALRTENIYTPSIFFLCNAKNLTTQITCSH